LIKFFNSNNLKEEIVDQPIEVKNEVLGKDKTGYE